ncbi:class I SAM-dependent methyltransferase [Rubrobacter indicoceani]|uniref:class I SAM-dependent methyltransferase n=1 Tax=Rubrobacter indicoceani TaxID=2051957 RepID=UPI000E5C07C0|nr:class I SAM-dependent methyltransferase [Rubrobacter indicoceani]
MARERLRYRPDHAVLDAGCGTGRNLPELARLSGELFGTDHSAESLKVARRRLDSTLPPQRSRAVRLLRSDLRDIPLSSSCMDRIHCAGVLQMLPDHRTRLDALREFLRLLKPGGSMLVFTYRWGRSIRRDKEGHFPNGGAYRFAFTGGEIFSLFSEAGFRDVELGGAVLFPRLGGRLGLDHERIAQRRLLPRSGWRSVITGPSTPAGVSEA